MFSPRSPAASHPAGDSPAGSTPVQVARPKLPDAVASCTCLPRMASVQLAWPPFGRVERDTGTARTPSSRDPPRPVNSLTTAPIWWASRPPVETVHPPRGQPPGGARHRAVLGPVRERRTQRGDGRELSSRVRPQDESVRATDRTAVGRVARVLRRGIFIWWALLRSGRHRWSKSGICYTGDKRGPWPAVTPARGLLTRSGYVSRRTPTTGCRRPVRRSARRSCSRRGTAWSSCASGTT